MKQSSKILAAVLGLGLLYSLFRLLTVAGGGGLGDGLDAIVYTSFALTMTSILILALNFRNIKKHIDTFLILLVSLPLTFLGTKGMIEDISYNRHPDLTAKYSRPVTDVQFKEDSTHIKIAVDSFVVLRNRLSGGTKIEYAVIDTIIYSQRGDKVFVAYVNKFEPNGRDNDFSPAFFFADTRSQGYWDLEEVRYSLGGGFREVVSLKKEIRKFYFNQFLFSDKDSSKKNFFWNKIMHPGD